METIVNYNHPMLVIDHFEVFSGANPNMVVPHAMGFMMDTQERAYVSFPKRELPSNDWVSELVRMTKGYPGITKQLLVKALGHNIAARAMADHGL